MNCSTWQEMIGLRCAPLGDEAVLIRTPHRLASGHSIRVTLEPVSETHVQLSDAGDLLFWAIANGIDIRDGRRLRGVRREVRELGADFDAHGELALVAARTELGDAYSRFEQACLRVKAWHDRHLAGEPDAVLLVEQVGELLRAMSPGMTIERDVEISGLSRGGWLFDFRRDGELIDCIGDSAQSSGAEVRKLIDIRSSSVYERARILVIVDDRRDPDRAKHEINIVARLADAVPFSQFASQVPAAAGVH